LRQPLRIVHILVSCQATVDGLSQQIREWQLSVLAAPVLRIVHRTKFTDLTPDEQRHHPFLAQVLPLTESMQKAWRNKISHANGLPLVLKVGDMSPDIAKDIVNATRAFMRRLAADLP
jgi:hypothetical protein